MKINSLTSSLYKIVKNLLSFEQIFAVNLFIIIAYTISIVGLNSISSELINKKSLIYSSLGYLFIGLETENCSNLKILTNLLDINFKKRIGSQNDIVWIGFFRDLIVEEAVQKCSISFFNYSINNLYFITNFPSGISLSTLLTKVSLI